MSQYVIRHLTGVIDIPNNIKRHDPNFLKWLTQICITMWEYQCGRAAFVDLERCAGDFIFAIDFRPFENDAAYLAIIAFVLGGSLDNRLPEYVDAVVWHSRAEFASVVPLRNAIIRECSTSVPAAQPR